MHREAMNFLVHVKGKFPDYFTQKRVVEFGSLDINGSPRGLFQDCTYTGVDLHEGPGVDIICPVSAFYETKPDRFADVVVSAEMLEHDEDWASSLEQMYRMLKPNGLMLITCATDGREEHGTTKHHPEASPATNDYYHNISMDEFAGIYTRDMFADYYLEVNESTHDLYFYGIKR